MTNERMIDVPEHVLLDALEDIADWYDELLDEAFESDEDWG